MSMGGAWLVSSIQSASFCKTATGPVFRRPVNSPAFSPNPGILKRWLREDKLDKRSLAERIGKVWKGRSDRYSEVRTPLSSASSSRTEMWQIGG